MIHGLGRLITELGERSTYDAASQCSRCGYCEQACPTYVATGRESRSGRGRNQIVRLLLEGKAHPSPDLAQALSTCLLCGGCTSACYAGVPTPDIVLEGRRMIAPSPAWVRGLLTFLFLRRPGLLPFFLKAGYAFRRTGLPRLAAAAGLPRLLGLGWLGRAEEHLEETPGEFLFEILRRSPPPEKPAAFYFAACGPNYLYPRVGLATVKALAALRGPVRFLEAPCCGLVCHNYGDVSAAQDLARRTIERWESAIEGPPNASGRGLEDLPVVVDCSSCAAFMKSYPQLLLDDPAWRKRAETFAGRVRDAVELLAEGEVNARKAAAALPGVVTWHDSCRLRHGQGIADVPRAVLRSVAGGRFVELPESDHCCGGAGAFGFSHPELSDALLRRKIGNVASIQASVVAVSATSCLLQLAHGLKKYYPAARVMHLSELVAEALNGDEK